MSKELRAFIASLEARIARLEKSVQELSDRPKQDSRRLIASIEAEIASLKKQVQESYARLNQNICTSVASIEAENARLKKQVQELSARLKQDSRTSHKPPSSDGYKKKTRSLRVSGQKSSGGQIGHPGHTLAWSDAPTEIIDCLPEQTTCAHCREEFALEMTDQRQVMDIPIFDKEIREYRLWTGSCRCDRKVQGKWPSEVRAPVQYGKNISALAVELHQQQMIPLKRISSLLKSLYNYNIGQATILKMSESAAKICAPAVQSIGAALSTAPIVHADETGLRVQKKLHWLHVAANKSLTFLSCHPRRGLEAIHEAGVLTDFQGVLVHDCWKPYFCLPCEHSLCIAHVLRELKAIKENGDPPQPWAGKLFDIFLNCKKEVEIAGGPLDPEALKKYERQARLQLKRGLQLNPQPPPLLRPKRGRRKLPPALNLINRIEEYWSEIFRFARQPGVPFTNNLAEQKIRMVKVKQKVSGCFRTLLGAQHFCTIRSYLATMASQGHTTYPLLVQAFSGNLVQPILASE